MLAQFRALSLSSVNVSSVAITRLRCNISGDRGRRGGHDTLVRFLVPLRVIRFSRTTTTFCNMVEDSLRERKLIVKTVSVLVTTRTLDLNIALIDGGIHRFSQIDGLSVRG